MGVISFGLYRRSLWHLLSRGDSAVKPITPFDTSPFQACLAAEVQDFDPEDFCIANRPDAWDGRLSSRWLRHDGDT